MSDKIKLVQGDLRPRLDITLTDATTGSVIDLSAAATTVSVEFRKAGTDDTPTSIPCTKVGGGGAGQVYMDWTSGTLGGDPGDYEAQIVINFNGAKHTVYEVMRFYMRDNFTA